MIDLSDRQIAILKAIIEEYIETAEAVGSETLDKKYNLGVSPATIRNEMVRLTNLGLLRQIHTSAGRIPTSIALKFYINQLLKEQELSVADEVAVKEKIWDQRNGLGKLLKEATRVLADKTNALALATTNNGDLYHSGYANILREPEFFDIDVTRTVLDTIEDINKIGKIFEKAFGEEIVHILFGDEVGIEFFEPCGIVFTNFEDHKGIKGSLGIIGSNRQDYSRVIPTVKYVGSLVEQIINSW